MKLFLIALLGALSLVAQTPTPKPQPADAVYGVDQLTLLPTYTRDSYETTFGRQAPPITNCSSTPIRNFIASLTVLQLGCTPSRAFR